LADNVIFLRYVLAANELRLAVGVLKMRGSRHDLRLHELVIDPPRLAIGAPLRQAAWRVPAHDRDTEEA